VIRTHSPQPATVQEVFSSSPEKPVWPMTVRGQRQLTASIPHPYKRFPPNR